MGEFDLIETIFKPLTLGRPEALNLQDDAALVDVPEGYSQVITKDALVSGIHFFADDPPASIARKALRTNLSDLAAKGAAPFGYFLAVMLPKGLEPSWLQDFGRGLLDDLHAYGGAVLGGDTVSTTGPFSVSITAIGLVPTGQALLRSGAKAGDLVCVSGTLGDSALGLKLRTDPGLGLGLSSQDRDYLLDRYLHPQPQLGLGASLRGLATACADISDGLLADLGHICKASGLAAELAEAAVPLSAPAKAFMAQQPELKALPFVGGDDYQLVFTAPEGAKDQLAPLDVTVIGRMVQGQGVTVLDAQDQPVAFAHQGFQHC